MRRFFAPTSPIVNGATAHARPEIVSKWHTNCKPEVVEYKSYTIEKTAHKSVDEKCIQIEPFSGILSRLIYIGRLSESE